MTATTKPSDSPAGDAYMPALEHPLKDLVAAVRKTILAAGASTPCQGAAW